MNNSKLKENYIYNLIYQILAIIIPFITTPFGFEGYSTSLIDDFFCVVKEGEKWSETIINFIKNNKF